MKAKKTFFRVLNIIHTRLYFEDDGSELSIQSFMNFFFSDIMKESPKKHLKSYHPFLELLEDDPKYVMAIYRGSRDFTKKTANRILHNINHDTLNLQTLINEYDYNIDCLIDDFQNIGIVIDKGKPIDTQLLRIIDRYLNAIVNDEDDPYELKRPQDSEPCNFSYSNGVLHMNGQDFDISEISTDNYKASPELKHEQEMLKAFQVTDENELQQNDKKYFLNQRKAFIEASCIRGDLRNCIDQDGHHPIFENVITEIKEGLDPTYFDDYESSEKRMKEVIKESNRIRLSSILYKESNVLTPIIKQGVCHILIDEEQDWENGWEDAK